MAQLKDFLWKEKRIISVENPDECFYTDCSFSFIKQNKTRIVRKENISKYNVRFQRLILKVYSIAEKGTK